MPWLVQKPPLLLQDIQVCGIGWSYNLHIVVSSVMIMVEMTVHVTLNEMIHDFMDL